MPKQSAEKFLELIGRSKLIELDRLHKVVGEARLVVSAEQGEDSEFLAAELIKAGLLTRWQCDRLQEGRHKGFFLGKYKLLGLLGTGGMSSVYLAEHVLMQRRVAIKVLPQKRVDDSSYLARFQREARAAAALDHANIVRAYDIDNDENIHYIVMEYVEGRDLQHIVKADGVLDYLTAANYIAQAADGLQHAHEANLIHRDVKPANLLVDQRGTVKILDMGLAKFANAAEQASLTMTYDENVLGTADYLPPEQAMDSHGVDSRADLYSLGCTLYFALTGHPPFPDGTLPQRLMAHQTRQPPSILRERPDCPRELLDICAKLMAKKPAQRYATAGEVGTALRDFIQAQGGGSGSGQGSGPKSGDSSGRLVVSGARFAERGAAPTPQRHPTPRPAPRPTPAPAARREQPNVVGDTVPDLKDGTMKSPGAVPAARPSAVPATRPGDSDKHTGQGLRTAKPIENNPFADLDLGTPDAMDRLAAAVAKTEVAAGSGKHAAAPRGAVGAQGPAAMQASTPSPARQPIDWQQYLWPTLVGGLFVVFLILLIAHLLT